MKNLFANKLTKREKTLLKLIAVHWKKLIAAMLCMVVVAAATSLSAYLVKPMLDDIFINKKKAELLFLPGAAVLIFFLKGMGAYGQQYWMKYVGEAIIMDFRNALYEKIIDMPMAFFHCEKIGTLMSRITNDVNIVKGMVSTAVTSFTRDAFTIAGLTGVIFYMDWKLAIGAFLILPVAFYPISIFGRKVRKFSTGCQESMADLNSFLHETFSGTKVVKIFTMEEFEKKRFREKADDLFRLEMKSVMAKAISSPVMEFLGGLGIAFIIWFGGSRVVSGVSTPGTFFSFLTAVMMLYAPVKKMSSLNNTIQEGLAAVVRIFDILEKQSKIKDPENPVLLEGSSFDIQFIDVNFAYDSNNIPVLNNINLKVDPGEILAIVGMSGGGKTSLVNLIPRFYDVSEGKILISGKNIKDIPVNVLRSKISIVTQEPILFNETVKDNIRYGKWDATDQEIEDASKAAYAYDFIMNFPNKFDTVIGELGNRLSGGEKQRICIARALIKDAPVLILDEATSSLDSEAEQVVQKALGNLMKGRTTFVIAHRLSTIDHAHRIILIKDGKIIEQGTHDQLMRKKGEYFKLQTMQKSKNVIEQSVPIQKPPFSSITGLGEKFHSCLWNHQNK